MEYTSSHLHFHSTYRVNISDMCDIPWYSTRERCITILYHTIENTVANTVNLANVRLIDGKIRCNTVKYTMLTAFLYSDWLYFLLHCVNIQYRQR